MKTVNRLDQSFTRFKFDNFSNLFWIGMPLYLLISLVDASLAKGPLLRFFTIRFIFITPYILAYLFRKKIPDRWINPVGFFVFLFIVAGASTASYFIGGLKSDYYFGVLEISFAQFLVFPVGLLGNLLFEVCYIAIYFPLNYFSGEPDQALLIKQLSNYISFSLFKIAVANSFRKTIFNSFQSQDFKRKLEHQAEVKSLLGELCHLLNNPLFISKSYIKRLYKSVKEESDDKEKLIYNLDKSFAAHERMQEILSKMLKVQSDASKDANFSEEFKEKDNP